MILAIDIGNTRTKAALFQEGEILVQFSFNGKGTLDALRMVLRKQAPNIEYIGVASVGSKKQFQELKAFAKGFEHAKLIMVNAAIPLPFKIGIREPGTLGADRIAAVAGGLALAGQGPLLVITAGTAITWNLLDADHVFTGGAISPGLQMRFRALHEFTAQLPLLQPEDDFQLLGTDTESAIRSGVMNGLIAEMQGMIEAYSSAAGPGLKVLLTGGDSAFLANHLKKVNFADEFLQLKGIHLIVSHNRAHD